MTALNPETDRLVNVTLDPGSIKSTDRDQAHERRLAVFDLLEENLFAPAGKGEGPFALHISLLGNLLAFDIRAPETNQPIAAHILSLTPFRRLIRDYFRVRDSYYEAIKSAGTQQLEAIDMGRRGLHNDAGELLIERLHGKANMDLETARRLFTLICTLQPAGQVQPAPSDKKFSVLFVCSMNSVRSPIAAALARQKYGSSIVARSAGVRSGQVDGFAHTIMEEIGVDLSVHTPHTMDELIASQFDLVVTLSENAKEAVQLRNLSVNGQYEHWPTMDPTIVEGSRDQKLLAYRQMREDLATHIADRLKSFATGGSQKM